MKNKIIENINNPETLEQLYQQNKQDFSKSFAEISEDYNFDLVKFWKIRLAHETDIKAQEFSKLDLLIVLLLSLVTGLLAKLPAILSQINTEFFYTRDLAIIVFNGIILYTLWQNKIFNLKRLLTYGLVVLILIFFLNLLPNTGSDSVMLSMIHAPLLLWCLFGLSFISFDYKNMAKRIAFIRFNGELLIMTGLFLIAGSMLTGITIGLFSAINMDVERFYMENIAIIGGVAAPIISFYLIRLYPTITNKIAPVIARVFTPLVLITLAVYLVSIIFSQSNIFEDRNLLLLFNVMLIAVMALIVFSISELDKSKKKNINVLVLFLLASLAIIINSIALIAIILRATEGLTPNRTVVLISNILIFVNLILIARNLYKSYFNPNQLNTVEQTVAKYLTIYAGYTIIVIFILPFLFGLK
ncbi:DUF4153 domain-containing protein [Prolixibacter sp. SD074]|jgi:hypothetical protein|uniref:DUF4153 domain-containing protein n=1 Tax=Prolixibacter sp. SD074 TaxID=2652391 RepID=UPI00127A6AC9|nr:DUF4153 domain-containing protein [Prolixibacter sp. SD074]GET27990.1 DUF4153 domain-containing protein [Prolixibacter sp. SD074]